ncbi:putative membrane protein [Bacteroides fragilis str. S6R8]|nr:putative membrane protein [Bacteroides fragilis str. S6R8]
MKNNLIPSLVKEIIVCPYLFLIHILANPLLICLFFIRNHIWKTN